MIKFTPSEKKYLESMEESRLATVKDKTPHVKPVSYIFFEDAFFVATDYDTVTYRNISKNPKAGLVVDTYLPGKHKAVCCQGDVILLESGKEFLEMYQQFFKKFAWVRNDPWKENEAPILKIVPVTKTSWGLG